MVPKDVIMLRLIPTAVHTLEDVNYTIETGVADLNVGFWYLDGIDDGYDELDLYVSTGLGTYFGFDASLTYIHYFFPSGGASTGDLTLGLGTSLGFADFGISATSSLGIADVDYWYYEAGLEKAFGPIVIGAGIAYDCLLYTSDAADES